MKTKNSKERVARSVWWCLALWGFQAITLAGIAQNLDALLDSAFPNIGAEFREDDVLKDLIGDLAQGTLFRLVALDQPEQALAPQLFWRRNAGSRGVLTAPVKIKLNDKDVIAPRTVQDPATLELSTVYPTEGHFPIAEGENLIMPGNLPLFSAGGKRSSSHPAVQVAGDEIRILCAPVRFEAVDRESRLVPLKIRVSYGNMALLREEADFNPLIIYLPVGVDYDSSLGSFRVTPDGKVEAAAAQLQKNVHVTAEGLRLVLPAARRRAAEDNARVPDPGRLFLVTHRGRTVFSQSESSVFSVLIPGGFPGGDARLLAASPTASAGMPPLELGRLPLPAVTGIPFDSRLLSVDFRGLPPGDWNLWAESPAGRSVPQAITVVPWQERSPFFLHTMSCCTECWPTSDEGLAVLHQAGLEMATFAGHASTLGGDMPGLDATKLRTPGRNGEGLPPELALVRSPNDLLLERMLRHQIRSLDLVVVRAAGYYLEGLSYHHSYKPSVDRMIRRLQIFTQQTADYPSFWGVNYNWFPVLSGYAEGGVPTDAHTHDRNVALGKTLAAAGYTNATPDDFKWYAENKFSTDAVIREKALAILRRGIAYWKAQMDFGFGCHNKLYNDAVRQVRPQTVCTLFDNAGHDSRKRPEALFNDMAASCYESYTDYGEWPLSASFTTDWARGNNPGKPVWITMDWGTSSEGAMKSLIHAFARGLAGGGVPMQASNGNDELTRRGRGLRFVGQYGALAGVAEPDRRVAILATASEQFLDGRAQYAYHALYYHLTRLGYPALILTEETALNSGIPAGVKVLVVVRQQQPLEPDLIQAITAFQKQGGRVVLTGDSRVTIDGSIKVEGEVKHIWQFSGFRSGVHQEMWQEFETRWQEPLGQAMTLTGVEPLASTDPFQAIAAGLTAGPVRYVAVLADKKGSHFGQIEPVAGLPVSLEGTGWTVRDLVKQTTLAASPQGERTTVAVDLITEPATILALYKSAPAAIRVNTAPSVPAGASLVFSCQVAAADQSDLGPVPVTIRLLDAAGTERAVLHRAAGQEVDFPVAALETPGRWTLRIQELLTGLTVDVPLDITPPPKPAAPASALADVHVVNESHLAAFVRRPGEKTIIVEPGRPDILPLARQLAENLKRAGVAVRLWEVRPEEFDTIPMRYYPRPEDSSRLALIDAGQLIGLRENMQPYIDKKARVNVPAKGGTTELEPSFMVGQDCILFSGGPLADSLRQVTPWMNTPSIPGRGQGRLLTVFSPFMADRQVVAVIANDTNGLAAAAARLAGFFLPAPPPAAVTAPPPAARQTLQPEASPAPVATPFLNYVPLRRVARLLAADNGKAVILLNGRQDNAVFVDEKGAVTASVALPAHRVASASIDNSGNLWTLSGRPDTVRCFLPDGTIAAECAAYAGPASELGPFSGEGSFPIAPDGDTAAFGRAGGMFLGRLGQNQWSWYDDLPHVKNTFEVWTPRFPVAMTFSPDSRYLFCTMDTRPIGYENMNQRMNRPDGAESVLLEVATGRRVWSLRGEPSDYACFNGFVDVAGNGDLTAFADVFGRIGLVDRSGKLVQTLAVVPRTTSNDFVVAPPRGVGVRISPNGQLAAFAFRNELILGRAAGFVRVPLPDVVSVAIAPDGKLAVVGLGGGTVKAFAADGSEVWSWDSGGIVPHLAAVEESLLVATSSGELVTLGMDGKEKRRLNVAGVADKTRHEPARAAAFRKIEPPFFYKDPGTLDTAVKRLKAAKLAEWTPADPGQSQFGLTFHAIPDATALSATPAGKESFVHLVYRRLPENRKLTVVTEGGGHRQEFILDLPTPGYRVVDIPLRGSPVKVTIRADGPAEVSEFSIWGFEWPDANIAYVRGANASAGDAGDLFGSMNGGDLGDFGLELDIDGGGAFGGMKDCRLWVPNPDVDHIAGHFLVWRGNPLDVVNGQRWEGKMPPWTAAPFQGAWFTEEFGNSALMSLVATYDRVTIQSQVTTHLAVFSGLQGDGREEAGRVLGAAIHNDQFWRIFSFAPASVKVLGVQAYRPDNLPAGLVEVEAYR